MIMAYTIPSSCQFQRGQYQLGTDSGTTLTVKTYCDASCTKCLITTYKQGNCTYNGYMYYMDSWTEGPTSILPPKGKIALTQETYAGAGCVASAALQSHSYIMPAIGECASANASPILQKGLLSGSNFTAYSNCNATCSNCTWGSVTLDVCVKSTPKWNLVAGL